MSLPIPEFTQFPQPVDVLEENESGTVFFRTQTPFDFDVILNDYESAIETTGVGYLFLPEGASAENAVPAMIVMHGSGGISAGREMTYGRFLAENGIAAFVVDYYLPRGVNKKTPYNDYYRFLHYISETDTLFGKDFNDAFDIFRYDPEEKELYTNDCRLSWARAATV